MSDWLEMPQTPGGLIYGMAFLNTTAISDTVEFMLMHYLNALLFLLSILLCPIPVPMTLF